MREHYIERLRNLKQQYESIQNQYNCVSGIDINNKTIDALIMRMRAIEMMLDSVYIQAKANKIVLN